VIITASRTLKVCVSARGASCVSGVACSVPVDSDIIAISFSYAALF